MILNKKLEKDIKEYCILNDLKYKDFVNDLLKKAFLEEKYGKSPFNKEKKCIFAEKELDEENSVTFEEPSKEELEVSESNHLDSNSEYKLIVNKKNKKRKLT